jgi:hypothetical protein
MRKLSRTSRIVLTLAMLFAVTGGATSAVAAPVVHPERLVSTATAPMTIVGFDQQVAAAHGFAIRPDSNGVLASVPVTASARASVLPTNGVSLLPASQLDGACGSSWAYLYDVGVRQYRTDTGFALFSRAVSYSWYVNIVGPAYNSTPHWSGGLALSQSWQASYWGTVTLAGMYSAKALTSSYALLWNGATCHSMGPIENRAIY